jgi:microcystin-dependent protein
MTIDSAKISGNPLTPDPSFASFTWGFDSGGANGGHAPDNGLSGDGSTQGLSGTAHNNMPPYLALNYIIKT